ncbi:MAG: ketopantoate reductase family protein [Anaerolineales bacterium]|nr:ketopantoate reductase family protein [Anaerolineales bacterium]
MDFLIIGAGVLGSLYALRLHEAGHKVTLLARGQRLEDLRQHGLTLENAETGEQNTAQVRLIEALPPNETFDWALVVLRKNQVASVLPALAANQAIPNIAFLVNNAAGAGEMVAALGAERVVLGFPGGGGRREGALVRYRQTPRNTQPTTLGELDGQPSLRLHRLANALEGAGMPVAICDNMDAWLKTHVALVSPMANAIYAAGGDNHRLARTRDGLTLMVRAVREGLQVLEAMRVPITPARIKILKWIPEPLIVAVLQRSLGSERALLLLASHANAARDEMTTLADEFQALARRSGLPTPNLDRLYAYTSPSLLAMPEGAAQLPLDWRGVWAAAGLLTASVVLLGWLGSRKKQ